MMAKESIKAVHASLVILVIDDFTGKPVRGSNIRVSIEGQRPPVVKEDGYHIFLNLTETCFTLVCESSIYKRRSEQIDLSGWGEKEVMVIRLLPDSGYPASSSIIRVSGRTQAGRRLLFWNGGESGYRLQRDYECSHGEKIAIYNPDNKMLTGKKFFICGKDDKKRQYFKIVEIADGYCRMDRALPEDYKRIGSRIIPVCEIYADENGAFFLPVFRKHGQETELVCQAEGDEEKKTFLLMPEKVNAIVL